MNVRRVGHVIAQFYSKPAVTGLSFANHRFIATSSSPTSHSCDVLIVGGGIVGLATARELALRHPTFTYALVEKESKLSQHQSAKNSGVIHAGIYYAPGSLKATLCLEGLTKSYKYLDKHKIPYKKCGKLIVAVDDVDLPRLDTLMERARANKVPNVRFVTSDEIREIEPNCVGKKAIFSPETGIVDWKVVAESFGRDFEEMGGKIFTNFEANRFATDSGSSSADYPIAVENRTTSPAQPNTIQCKYVITCCGLQSDRIARKTGCSSDPAIVPFRGDYLRLKPEFSDMVRSNIYPVPDPRFPFLGVHFTPRIDGSVWLGPTAVLSLAREGYGYFDVNIKDALHSLTYPGLVRLAGTYFRFGINEFVSNLIIKRQIKQLQRFVPSLKTEHVERGPSGIRAQAISRDGKLVEDFVIDAGDSSSPFGRHIMHVRNAPSPAATSSLAIARYVADKANKQFEWPEPKQRTEV